MMARYRIDFGPRALLSFRGPDAMRFLNGQLTQDVRLVAGGNRSLPSCVTDAKGHLQFRVWLTQASDGSLWIDAEPGQAGPLEARLTRYLIADDVEVSSLTGSLSLIHFTGVPGPAPAGVTTRESVRFGLAGTDWWVPDGLDVDYPEEFTLINGEPLESLRIRNGVPAWGRELTEGLLPPEAGLETSDVSYQKGCYIGQEVISRIKSAGKVNQHLIRMVLVPGVSIDAEILVDATGKPVGRITSVSPAVESGERHAMGYVKRGAVDVFVQGPDPFLHPVRLIG